MSYLLRVLGNRRSHRRLSSLVADGRAPKVLTAFVLLFNSCGPIWAFSSQDKPKENRVSSVALPKPPKVAGKGIPLMHAQLESVNPVSEAPLIGQPVQPGLGFSLLDDEGYLRRPVDAGVVKDWSQQLAGAQSKSLRARLLIQLGEVKLGNHWPSEAQTLFDKAAALVPISSPDRGLARFDSALAMFLQGRFSQAENSFRHLAQASIPGANRRTSTIYARHCAGCAGYHDSHAALGIPEPPYLDPFCGVSGVAVCLNSLGYKYSRTQLEEIVPHTGEGTSMGEICDSFGRLGVVARMVSTNDEGLRKLPKPLIAHVERDHFVTVVRADRSGVSYVCSDCGPWPGGKVLLSWKQWDAMEADRFVAVAKVGTATALALENLPTIQNGSAGHVYLAATQTSNVKIVAAAESLLSSLGTLAIAQTNPVQSPYTPICGDRGTSPHCVTGVNNCPTSGGGDGCGGGGAPAGGGGASGPGNGGGSGNHGNNPPTMRAWGTADPVNLATTEEEYSAPAGITVYNPSGPSVNWTHSWYSLANVTPTGFGSGWTHPYNVRIQDNSAETGTVQPVGNPSTAQSNAIGGGRRNRQK